MGYQAVEYTHGPTEQGADFVLTDFDQRLRVTKYIGVIAKTGKILGSTIDIENQIIQCASRRFIESGKKEIRISSIIVVTSKSISHNAERSIHEKYATQNVEFIDRDRLTELINDYVPEFWHDIPSDLGEYLTYIRVKNENNDRSLSISNSQNVEYIQQDIVRHDESFYNSKNRHIKNRREVVNLEEEIIENRFIFIEGNVGSGKSKLLRRMVDHFSSTEVYKEKNVIPIFLTFRELFDNYECDTEKVIDTVLKNVKRNLDISKKKVVIFIDGFDEKILDYDTRSEVLDKIRQSTEYGRIHIVMTSRYLFTSAATPNALKIATRYEISPLSMKQLIKYLEKLCESFNIHGRLLEDIKKSHLMRDIPRSPIAAIILAQLIQQTGQDLPSNLTELYAKYIELTLGRWDMQKGMRSQKEYEIVENILMEFATQSIDNEIQSITPTALRDLISNYCSSRQLGISEGEIYNLIKERGDIIVINESVGEVIFKHRSFAEFLYAKYKIRNQEYTVDNRAFNVYWSNIHFFSFGILKDAPIQLRKLYEIPTSDDSERFLKSLYISDYLMAAYQTPYDVISEGVELAAQIYGELYSDISDGKSPLLNNLPKMVVLYIFQLLFRNNYSYDYLKKALDSAGTNIAAKNPDFAAYSLFFLDTALVEENREGNFQMLMDACGTTVPIDLALAVRHETKDNKVTYEGVKKNNKRIQRILKDKSASTSLAKLYDIPMSKLVSGIKRR